MTNFIGNTPSGYFWNGRLTKNVLGNHGIQFDFKSQCERRFDVKEIILVTIPIDAHSSSLSQKFQVEIRP